MSKKAVLSIVIVVGVLAAVLLVVQVVTTQSAPGSPALDLASEERLAGSDNILLHPPVPLPAKYDTGSEPATAERLAGSDNICLHPPVPLPADFFNSANWNGNPPCQPTP